MNEQIGSNASDKEELFVFGYECKIFRDDEKAQWVEDEKHLIPWMGDSSLLIDRYDGRGALMDLRSHETPTGGVILSLEDAEIERRCDVERFLDYRDDQEFDESAYQEEEFKRLQLALSGISDVVPERAPGYAAIEYSYNENIGSTRIGPEPKKVKENSPYIKPPGLFPPPDVILPKSMKSHAIIEKTAKFIASQDGQMEIILKTKQAKNPQFEFLNFSDPLNPYYKFLVTAIQTCAYQPSEEIPISPDDSPSRDSGSDEEDSPESSDSYLHPSLAQNSTPMSTLISKSMYKPTTTHSAYSMLVSKIKEVSTTTLSHSPPVSPFSTDQNNSTIHHLNKNMNDKHMSPNEQKHNMPFPLPQEQVIIDKMANYVIKNGPAFESLANHKGDPRFMFLDQSHPLHWYYLSCKERYAIEAGAVVATRQFVGYGGNSPNSTHSSTASTTTLATKASELKLKTKTISTISPLVSLKYTKNTTPSMPAPNHANALNRMATLPPELISKIEELRKKTLLNRLKNSTSGGLIPTAFVSPSPDSNDLVTSTSTQQTKLKREQVIKFSSALSQRILGGESESTRDLQQTELSGNNVYKENGSNESSTTATGDSEEIRRRKEERRKKAALFLQQLKQKKIVADSQKDEQPEAEKLQDEKENQDSDAEPIVSPILRKTEVAESTNSIQNYPDSTLHETSIGQVDVDLKQSKPEVEIIERFKESITQEVEVEDEEEEGEDVEEVSKEIIETKRSKRRKHIRKVSVTRSPTLSPISDEEHSSSTSYRRKSKSKHSKKRRKKHEKSHSHSKKSKRDKYE